MKYYGASEFPEFCKLLEFAVVAQGSNAIAESKFSELGKLNKGERSMTLPQNSNNLLYVASNAKDFPHETFNKFLEKKGCPIES